MSALDAFLMTLVFWVNEGPLMATETTTRPAIVQPDGSVTIPKEILDQAGMEPGSEVFFWTNGPGKLHMRLIPSLSPDELFERFGSPEITEIDWQEVREEAEAGAANEFVASLRRHE